MTRFGILGTMEVEIAGRPVPTRGPKVRKVLALLLLKANQVVSVDALIEELWEGRAPGMALSTVRTHVYHLRQMLSVPGVAPSPDLIVTRAPGYLLRLDESELDVHLFSTLVGEARALLRHERHHEAVERLDQALALWRGDPLADVHHGRLIAAHVFRLRELRAQAVQLRIEAAMSLGRHRDLLPQLRELVAGDPLNEWLHARLIEALGRSGRRSEALTAMVELRNLLDRELGVEPSSEIRRLQYDILSRGDHLSLPARALPTGGPVAA